MYSSNNMPMTSQQSRRKSQVNNQVYPHHENIDPLHTMNFHQQLGMMELAGGFGGGISDTGAPPESSGTQIG